VNQPNIIAEPGRNCWVRVHTDRLAFLVDGEAYFAAAVQAMLRARSSIVILGWDIDSRVDLMPGRSSDGMPRHLGPFLHFLACRRAELEVYILSWDYNLLYLLDREPLPRYKLGWKTHHRVHFRLDDEHPLGGSHHQKLVVVDDTVAFLGGLDLCGYRWDTPAHLVHDARRVAPDKTAYGPFHDVQVAVDGEAARVLGELARARWLKSTGELLRASSAHEDPWPTQVVADITDVDVAISRTLPAFEPHAAVHEIEAMLLDVIAAARHSIYIENQYLTAVVIREALARVLQRPDGPEVVLVAPRDASGWFERNTMGALRKRWLSQLRRFDHHGHLGAYYPRVRSGGDEAVVNVHSKVMIIDDRVIHVGSANASNRSMGFDTECDLTLEDDGDARIAETVAAMRARLLGEHLGVEASLVREVLVEQRSLLRTIDVLAGNDRSLEAMGKDAEISLDAALPDVELIDPDRPIEADAWIARLVPSAVRASAKRTVLRGCLALLMVVLMVGLLDRMIDLDYVDRDVWLRHIELVRDHPAALFGVTAVFLMAGALVVPLNLLILTTAVVFGPLLGFVYAFVGANVSAAVFYGLGRMLGSPLDRLVKWDRFQRLRWFLRRRGVLAMTTVRLLPVAPFTLVNLVCGACHLSFRDYMFGSVLGLLPGTAALTVFGAQIDLVLRQEAWVSYAALLLLGVAIVFVSVWAQLYLRKRDERTSEPA